MMLVWLATIAGYTLGGAYVGWNYLTPVAHEKRSPAPIPMTKPIHWTKRKPQCFFVGRSGYSRRACGNFRMAQWETYCEPDPNCMELPDGTKYAEEITKGPSRAASEKGLPYRGDEPLRRR